MLLRSQFKIRCRWLWRADCTNGLNQHISVSSPSAPQRCRPFPLPLTCSCGACFGHLEVSQWDDTEDGKAWPIPSPLKKIMICATASRSTRTHVGWPLGRMLETWVAESSWPRPSQTGLSQLTSSTWETTAKGCTLYLQLTRSTWKNAAETVSIPRPSCRY